jgi:hypothetical protein
MSRQINADNTPGGRVEHTERAIIRLDSAPARIQTQLHTGTVGIGLRERPRQVLQAARSSSPTVILNINPDAIGGCIGTQSDTGPVHGGPKGAPQQVLQCRKQHVSIHIQCQSLIDWQYL